MPKPYRPHVQVQFAQGAWQITSNTPGFFGLTYQTEPVAQVEGRRVAKALKAALTIRNRTGAVVAREDWTDPEAA